MIIFGRESAALLAAVDHYGTRSALRGLHQNFVFIKSALHPARDALVLVAQIGERVGNVSFNLSDAPFDRLSEASSTAIVKYNGVRGSRLSNTLLQRTSWHFF